MSYINTIFFNKKYYKLVKMQNSNRTVKFKTTSILSAIGYSAWHVRHYNEGLLVEIEYLRKRYDIKDKRYKYFYE